jgi:hypothetical protein
LAAQLPPGYIDGVIVNGIHSPVGVMHDANGKVFAWMRNGKVRVVENGFLLSPALRNIT